jgi:hypothetical protein
MKVHRLYRNYEVSGESDRTDPPSADLVYKSDDGLFWRRTRETKIHVVTIIILSLFVTFLFLLPAITRIPLLALLIPIIPVLLLAGEVAELIIYSREDLVVELHDNALWIPTVAYTTITWHMVPFGEIDQVRRSERGVTVSLKNHKNSFPIDHQELGEEGLRLLEEGIRSGIDDDGLPKLVLYDGSGHSG